MFVHLHHRVASLRLGGALFIASACVVGSGHGQCPLPNEPWSDVPVMDCPELWSCDYGTGGMDAGGITDGIHGQQQAS